MSARFNQVRIIAGQWRGRKLDFPDTAGLRPTPDRIRETLFNWLAPVLPGAHCLDLFAGSGALGFEAASRGATRVVMVERDPDVVRALQATRQRLDACQVDVVQDGAPQYLARLSARFDVVFLDPPFARHELLVETIELLQRCRCLNQGAFVYVETAVTSELKVTPPGWEMWRRKHAGAVSYQLYRCGVRNGG